VLGCLRAGRRRVRHHRRDQGAESRRVPVVDADHGHCAVAAGIYTFMAPAITTLVLLYMIAAFAIVRGVTEIAAAIRLRKEINNEWLLIVAGVASLVFGVLLFLFPGAGALALVLYIGAMAIVVGVIETVLGFKLRNRSAAHASHVPGTPGTGKA